MKHKFVKLLDFFGLWCGVKPSTITVKGPERAKYRVVDATINEHGDIVVHVVPNLVTVAMCLDEIQSPREDPLCRPGKLIPA